MLVCYNCISVWYNIILKRIVSREIVEPERAHNIPRMVGRRRGNEHRYHPVRFNMIYTGEWIGRLDSLWWVIKLPCIQNALAYGNRNNMHVILKHILVLGFQRIPKSQIETRSLLNVKHLFLYLTQNTIWHFKEYLRDITLFMLSVRQTA